MKKVQHKMHGAMDDQRNKPHWAACQVISNQTHLVRADIEKAEHGTFIPTYVQVKYVAGKKNVRELPLLPGYLFFKTEPDKWGDVTDISGVIGVLANGNIASRVTDEEMYRLTVEHATGVHNRIEPGYRPRKRNSSRRRRPRPGKRWRGKP